MLPFFAFIFEHVKTLHFLQYFPPKTQAEPWWCLEEQNKERLEDDQNEEKQDARQKEIWIPDVYIEDKTQV